MLIINTLRQLSRLSRKKRSNRCLRQLDIYDNSTWRTFTTSGEGTPRAVYIYTMGRRPPPSSSEYLFEVSYVSNGQNPTLANVFLIITGPIRWLAPSNSLPAISRKTNCKVTHFFLIADYCHVGIVQISLQEWRNCPARMAQLRTYFVWHEGSHRMEWACTSDETRARTEWCEPHKEALLRRVLSLNICQCKKLLLSLQK